MLRLARVALAIVGISVTVASSALPTAMPTTPDATKNVSSDYSRSLSSLDLSRDMVATSSPASVATANSEPSTTTAAATTATTAAASTSGAQQVYVEVVSATSSSADDVNAVSSADAQALVASMNSYWSGESAGAVAITFAGFETSSLGLSSCDAASLFNSVPTTAFGGQFANEAWMGTGKHLLILTTESCASSGQGTVGGNGGVILSGNGTGASLGVPVAVHEFGHNLGFGHAGSSICQSNVTLDGSTTDYGTASSFCPTDEYGDYLDIMGYSIAGSTPHLSTPQRIRMGWLADYTTVTSATPSVTTTVTPLDGGVGNRAIRVVDPTTGTIYTIEYRSATGADATSTEFTGGTRCTVIGSFTKCSGGEGAAGAVRILRELPYKNSTEYVRTTVLAVGSTEQDTSRTTRFAAGDTFATAGGVYMTVNSISAGGASVTVRFSPPAATSTSLALTATKQAYGAKTAIGITARVASADGGSATGTVTFLDGEKVLGTSAVAGGVATFAVPSTFSIGTHRVTAEFAPSGGDATASVATVKKLVVTKAVSKATVKVAKHRATVKLTTNGKAAAKATVKVYADGKRIATVKLNKKGTATVKVPAQAKKVVVKYAGTKKIAKATATKRLAR